MLVPMEAWLEEGTKAEQQQESAPIEIIPARAMLLVVKIIAAGFGAGKLQVGGRKLHCMSCAGEQSLSGL